MALGKTALTMTLYRREVVARIHYRLHLSVLPRTCHENHAGDNHYETKDLAHGKPIYDKAELWVRLTEKLDQEANCSVTYDESGQDFTMAFSP